VSENQQTRRHLLTVLGAGATIGLAGCSGDDSENDTTPQPTPTQTQTPETNTPTPDDSTPTPTETETPTPEPLEAVVKFLEVPQNRAEVQENQELEAEFSPVDQLESAYIIMEQQTEEGNTYRIFEVGESGEIPSNGLVESEIPYNDIVFNREDRTQIEDVTGEYNLIAEANLPEDTDTTTRNINIQHPRNRVNLEENNQRITDAAELILSSDEQERREKQDWRILDYKLAEELGGPRIYEVIKEGLKLPFTQQIAENIYPEMELTFREADFYSNRQQEKAINVMWKLDRKQDELDLQNTLEENYDLNRTYESNREQFDIFEGGGYNGKGREIFYHHEARILSFEPQSPGMAETTIDVINGENTTLADTSDFFNSPEYQNNIFLSISKGPAQNYYSDSSFSGAIRTWLYQPEEHDITEVGFGGDEADSAWERREEKEIEWASLDDILYDKL